MHDLRTDYKPSADAAFDFAGYIAEAVARHVAASPDPAAHQAVRDFDADAKEAGVRPLHADAGLADGEDLAIEVWPCCSRLLLCCKPRLLASCRRHMAPRFCIWG